MTIAAVAGLVVAAIQIAAEIPIQVAGDDQIETSVAIVVDEACGHGPSGGRHPGFLRYVGECAVAVIVIKRVAAEPW